MSKLISEMTPEEAADELVFMELRKLLRKARNAAIKAHEAERAVFRALEDMCIDLDVPCEAMSADNLGDAVSCFINYDEHTAAWLLREIKKQYCKREEE